MTTLTCAKLLKYGAVCFVPASNFDTVSQSLTWQGQTLSLFEPSDELPGYYGWFNPGGMADPNLAATDPGLQAGDNTPLMAEAKPKKAKATPDGAEAQAAAGEVAPKSDE